MALSAWDAASVSFALVYEAVRACGNADVGLPHGPDFFQFGTLDRMTGRLTEAGFADVTAHSVAQQWPLASAEHYIEAILTGTVRAGAVLAARSEASSAGVRSYVADHLARFVTADGELVLPMPAIIGSGVRPA